MVVLSNNSIETLVPRAGPASCQAAMYQKEADLHAQVKIHALEQRPNQEVAPTHSRETDLFPSEERQTTTLKNS